MNTFTDNYHNVCRWCFKNDIETYLFIISKRQKSLNTEYYIERMCMKCAHDFARKENFSVQQLYTDGSGNLIENPNRKKVYKNIDNITTKDTTTDDVLKLFNTIKNVPKDNLDFVLKLLSYLYDIVNGKVSIESDEKTKKTWVDILKNWKQGEDYIY